MTERPNYPVFFGYVGCYYCKTRVSGPFVAGRDDDAFNAARAHVQAHIKTEHPR